MMLEKITYNTSEIRFGNLTENGFNDLLHSAQFSQSKKVIITDENVYGLWMEHFITRFDGLREAEIIELPAGEENKVLEICHHVWNALSEYEIGRNDLIINIGGGVITDMGGFIAATFKRGLRFINVPTTLLSQVDASVGGKTGIDLGAYKNQIGVFADPEFVFIDSTYLTTLPEDELESGYAEMLKHGLISDTVYWNDLKKINPKENPFHLLKTIHRSVTIKKDIIMEDHREVGVRKTLNFGHTIGHALEGYFLSCEKPIPHGFGVAWGMVSESYISYNLGLLTKEEFEEIKTVITDFFPKTKLDSGALPQLQKLILNDKKNQNGEVRFTLLNGIGTAVYDQVASDLNIEKALRLLF